MRRVLRYPYRKLKKLATTFPKLVPLEECFDKVNKINVVPGYHVEVPEVLDMNLKEDAVYLQKQTYVVPEDSTAVLENVCISLDYNVVLNEEGDVVLESSNAGKPVYFPNNRLACSRQQFVPGYSVLLHSRFDNYYHFLIDDLPRLITLQQQPFTDIEEIKLLVSRELTGVEECYLEKVRMSNMQVVHMKDGGRHQVDKLIFTPYKTRWQSGYLPQYYVRRLREAFLPKRPRRNTRIFISRENARRRAIANREEVVAMLEKYGFRKVILETMSPQEQIDTLYDAEAVVGVHGAGLSNILFSPTGLKVVEIFPTPYVVPHYFFLSKSLGHDYTYQIGDAGLNDRTFVVDVKELRDSLHYLGVV